MSHFDAPNDNPIVLDGVVYRPRWQTWSLVTRRVSDIDTPAATRAPEEVSSANVLRERVQIARIDRRLSIVELAAMVQCDADHLAAFERGDGIMDTSTQGRLRRTLGV
ncbi:MAG: hypothetical protein VXX04_00515 [Actinomycetota bacterium]|nr:hypothetical protein [Actinomycetota bacterium]